MSSVGILRVIKSRILAFLCTGLAIFVCCQQALSQSLGDYAAFPPTTSDSSAPLVMLVMSRDNQLWHKAYNDYSDIDGNGSIDTTYNDNFEYYGYFHSDYCYSYSISNNQFSPIGAVDTGTHQCVASGSAWSGNFMNWLTTTRMDVVRKVLYGGYRSVDSATSTVLQRALVPSDNHAFVKIVRDSEIEGSISDYTPITGQTELSFCNVTDLVNTSSGTRTGGLNVSQNPPRLKVAVGASPTWAGSEARQCQFADEGGIPTFVPSRPATSAISGIPSDSELIVRVEVCVDGQDRSDASACREYVASDGSTSYKPYGLLQSYGETGTYKFGLMTGSYANKTQGGVLRKNIAFMGGGDAAADDIEIDTSTGIFINQGTVNEGIINTLNRLRIQGWDYNVDGDGDHRYSDCAFPGISIDTFLNSTAGDLQCRDWGNPISEIYIEALRYFAGSSETEAFAADDTSILAGLNTADWEDPFTAETACSNCSIIVLSTGLNNFDGDQLGSVSSLPGLRRASSLERFTNDVGSAEGLDTGTYIIGDVDTAEPGGTSGECDAKTIGNLSDARGLCPEVPTLQGSFNIAGAAFYAQQADLRGLEGTQNVSTYTVSLSESLPKFEIATGNGETVTFVPTCRSSSDGAATGADVDAWRECSLVDLTIMEQTSTYGRLMIAWEDSPWGNDYDMDAYSVIEYCTASGSESDVRSACPNYTSDANPNYNDRPADGSGAPENGYDYSIYESQPQWSSASNTQIQLRVSMIAASAGLSMKFGYTINGSSLDDGAYVNEIIRYGGYNGNSPALTGTDNNYAIWSQNARLYTATSITPAQLENPLWYAAKYGGFTDIDGDGLPGAQEEWDNFDIFGNSGSDGIPDSFFPVSNPANLPGALDNIFADINTRVSAGSAAAVNAQTGSGEGAIYQALYTPRLEDDNEEITWFGTVNALFMDDRGRVREDRNGDGVLDSTDRVLVFGFDETFEETRVKAYSLNADGSTGAQDGVSFSVSSNDFNPIWSASDQLDSLTNYDTNRPTYSSPASAGRYIFTAFDRDGDGQVIEPDFADVSLGASITTDTAHPFVVSNFALTGPTENENRYLGFEDTVISEAVENLVNFVRGEEDIVGARSRTLDGVSYLLGDIINSTPALVAAPADRYDLLYGDDSYREYLDHHRGRRNVVYVGANDGMLHAFNAGFFNPSTVSFQTTPDSEASETAHPLGAELWAYVPYNLLPHLQWLASPSYPHVYYVDGPVKSYDVNIFTADSSTYINGWGTILVASMRLGGGDYEFDHDDDATTPNITTRSAYLIFDVTDPEREPNLIAEITDIDLGFSTSEPTLVKYRQPNSSGTYAGTAQNEWALVFGSGPVGSTSSAKRDALDNGVSDKSAKTFLFDLKRKILTKTELTDIVGDPEAASFVGGFAAADWDLDYADDAIYFGLVSGTPETPEGKLKRGRVSFSASGASVNYTRDLYNDTNLPFSATPKTFRDSNNDFWVFAGTGRLFSPEDNLSDEQHYYFGIKEPKVAGVTPLNTTVNDSDLVDTTFVDVFNDGQVSDNGSTLVLTAGGTSVSPTLFEEVIDFVGDHAGWKFAFRNLTEEDGIAFADITRPEVHVGIQNVTKAAFAGNSLIISAYQGTNEICESEGTGWLYAPHLAAGAPAPFAPLATTDVSYIIDGLTPEDTSPERVLMGVDLGVGIPSDPIIIRPAGGDVVGEASTCDEYRAIIQTSAAEIAEEDIGCEELPAGRRGWREIPVNW